MSDPLFSVGGRVVLLTGAGRGVGAGVARELAARGAKVIVNDLHPERAAAVVDEITVSGGMAVAAPFDVTDGQQIATGLAAATVALGEVDILVNNAGVIEGDGRPGLLVGMPEEDWRLQIELNLVAFLRLAQVVLPPMIEAGWGRIVQISSTAASRGSAMGLAPYGAGKAGAEGLMRHVALENATHGITVNSLALGMMDGLPADDPRLSDAIRTIPTGRLTTPQDVAAAVIWLGSEAGAQVSGQVIHLNGGSHAGR